MPHSQRPRSNLAAAPLALGALLALVAASCGASGEPFPVAELGAPDVYRPDVTRPPVDAGPTPDRPYYPPPDAAPPPPDAAPPPDGPDPGVEINGGWFGGACTQPGDCNDPNITAAICETAGFPNGFCTAVCAGKLCPDTNYSATGASTSRCIDAAGQPRCVSECDYVKSPVSGCRPGYICVQRTRYQDPAKIFSVCLPAPYGVWPGEPAPQPPAKRAVGEPCIEDGECAASVCLDVQGGYCSRLGCDDATGCPAGSVCGTVVIGGSQQLRACVKSCTNHVQCRAAEGYGCAPDQTCRPAPRPVWNGTVGAADCLGAWNNNSIHPCDTVKDNYIVVRKSARNLALCHTGALLQSLEIDLGFSPLGDKVQQGDGKTPEGLFYVSRLNPASAYYKALVISYPDKDDAQRGLTSGLISAADKAAIDGAQNSCLEPPSSTALGGLIEIHGKASKTDSTNGCVAVTDAQMDGLWTTIGLHDSVVILP